ncbi:MAG: hypothetical protein RB296_06290 [Acidobacteriota bacterium]|jgi:hypothetical protein|nr:hypothetical protein [Acidobacteriota bacterium]
MNDNIVSKEKQPKSFLKTGSVSKRNHLKHHHPVLIWSFWFFRLLETLTHKDLHIQSVSASRQGIIQFAAPSAVHCQF